MKYSQFNSLVSSAFNCLTEKEKKRQVVGKIFLVRQVYMHRNQLAKTRMKKKVLQSVSVRSYGQNSSFLYTYTQFDSLGGSLCECQS